MNTGKLFRLVTHIAATGLLLAVGVAQAQTTPAPAPAAAAAPAAAPAPAASDSITWKGVTLYGIVDIGIQYQTHGVPINDYFPAGTEAIINKNSNGSVTAMTPNNLSQSRIGLAGNEPIAGDWAGVFRLETFFNPQSGNLSDALKSLTQNNGKVLADQNTNADSSVAGQLFAGAAYAGFSSPTVGSFTFGRHVTHLADGIAKYDPMGAAQAFSLIGWSGTAAGGGDTEDRRLDESIKYTGKYDWLHVGALYQIGGSSGSVNSAYQFTVGAEFAGLSIDGYYGKKYNAIQAAALSNTQVAALVRGCNAASTPPPPVNTAVSIPCYSLSNSLAATISDNKTYMIGLLYNFGKVKLYGAWENIKFQNPNTPLNPGYVTIGGYVLAVTNNTNFGLARTLDYYWVGVKWTATPKLEFTLSYLGIDQNSFATGATAGCNTNISAKCSGRQYAYGALVDYRLSKRFDTYLGTLYTSVDDGLANGFLQTSTLTTTTGIRFKF